MSLCLNPDCLHKNFDNSNFCQKCRSKLVLRERYRGIKIIGQGGFGKTFLAIDEDKPSKPYCVIKQFFPQAQGTDNLQKASELFKQEASRLDELGKHQQIPELLAYFTHEDNRQYLVQQYIEGQNLEQELKQEGVFNEAKVKDLLLNILPILEFVHGTQVIHRDIKPENIIRRQNDNKLFLVDFGAAKLVTPHNRSVTGTIIGSAEYIAPEQASGKPIYASDLYSLGATCIYLLTGISPFNLFDTSEHEWVWRQYLVNNSISNELGRILDKLIAFGTGKRYTSATEILQDLQIETLSVTTTTQKVISQPEVTTTKLTAEELLNRGCAKGNLGDKQGAIVDYDRAIQLQPDFANAYYNRGSAKSALGDKQGAIADYTQAIQLQPNDANAYNIRGYTKDNLGDYQGAIADYTQAAQLYQQKGKMELYRKAIENIKNSKDESKGFWRRLFS